VGFFVIKKRTEQTNVSKGEKAIKIYSKPQWEESLKNKAFAESFFFYKRL
jgi:hypothetical protein